MVKRIDEFKELLGDYLDKYSKRSIYNSELYVFWRHVLKYKIDRIVESGTFMGESARRLRRIFPDAEIITFEMRKEYYDQCGDIKGVKRKHGTLDKNLKVVTPTTAVLIDGPKRLNAVKLARKCLKKGAPVVGIHDMWEYVGYLNDKFRTFYHTGYMRDGIRALDKDVPGDEHNTAGYYGTVLAILEAGCEKS